MHQENEILQPQDFKKIFDDFNKLGNELYPELSQTMENFNENKISIESYEEYIAILNQPPVITTSNHVG
ncbi:hypothetical protein ACQ33O_03855 [Ferruginibacter sp. SUN002]|uniref:hypothetical protein n=1 Tax=Ferruginibacter sp. SUN002 TaxID=2937789 RepID=UPI003D359D3F